MLATHDDDSPEKVDAQWELGATVAEFPVTYEAAQRARDRGMHIVVGAPNLLRGGSQSGNLAAADLMSWGFADIICADYHAPSLFAAAFRAVEDGLADVPGAIRMVTLNPSIAVGLNDRGGILPGYSADLAVLRLDDAGFPQVESAYRQGRLVYAFDNSAALSRVAAGTHGR
jgi:alpha-D-ribose 1-methylphosphonate 5-triphosphate diphosphatase